jgi:hypothetical protein
MTKTSISPPALDLDTAVHLLSDAETGREGKPLCSLLAAASSVARSSFLLLSSISADLH